MGPLADYLRAEMDRARLSQSEMARRIGVYPDYIRRWLAGDIPRPEKVGQIAEALGVPISQIQQLAGYPVDESRKVTDPEKEAALREFERILDESPRRYWTGLTTVTRGAAQALSADVERDPAEHQGNDNGRDNVKQSGLETFYERVLTNKHGELRGTAVAQPA